MVIGILAAPLGQSDFGNIDLLLGELGAVGGIVGMGLVFLVVFGLVAVLISTADSGFIAVAHIAYEKLAGHSSHATGSAEDLRKVRWWYVVGLNAVAALPLLMIFQFQPRLIALLVSAITPLTVAAPLIASAAYCTARYGQSLLHRGAVASVLIMAIIAAWGLALGATVLGSTRVGHLVVVLGVVFGLVFFLVDARWARHSAAH